MKMKSDIFKWSQCNSRGNLNEALFRMHSFSMEASLKFECFDVSSDYSLTVNAYCLKEEACY